MRALRTACISFLCAAAAIFCLQWISGAYSADLGAVPDEPSHAVSSLLIHDYLKQGLPSKPVPFARTYYAHFPKVAIGHWPPLFYAVEASAMLVFGRSKAVLVGVVGLAQAALLTILFLWTRRDLGTGAALFAAIVAATPAFMQASTTEVMPDIPLALTAMVAAVAWGDYLETGKRRSLSLFIFVSVAAMAIHIRGVTAALIPLFTAWISPPPKLSRWWLAVFTLGLAFVLEIPNLLNHSGSIVVLEYFPRLGSAVAWLPLVLAVGGAIAVVGKRLPRRWLAMPGLALSAYFLHSAFNTPLETRYFVTIIPAVAALSAAGLWFIEVRLQPVAARATFAVCAGILLAVSVARFVPKPDRGYHTLLDSQPAVLRQRVSMIAGRPRHEGAFVAEVALRDAEQSHVVLRASQAISSSSWVGHQYSQLFSTTDQLREYLNSAGVAVVLIQIPPSDPHIAQLLAALTGDPSRWTEMRPPALQNDVRLFLHNGPVNQNPRIQVPIRDNWGGTVTLH